MKSGSRESARRCATVVVGDRATGLERHAGEELCGYLERLFGMRTRPTTTVTGSGPLFLVGTPESNPAIREATHRRPFPQVSEQGIVLRRLQYQKRPAMLISGGSPRATLWGVYELAERWGVRYLLQGDVLPEAGEFHLPDVDEVMEPTLGVRAWRVINDFACGPESWGMRDYRPVVDQLAKLKFNRLLLSLWPWQPFVHYEVRGIERRSASLWFGYHYPITEDMVGWELFGDEEEFWNPDLPLGAGYGELAAAGEALVHSLMAHAHERGMECILTATPTEFPLEFAPLLKGAQKVRQLGEMTVVPGADADVDDPALGELACAVLRATVNTYPEADYVALRMPEWRQWVGQYERAWRELERKYDVGRACTLQQVLAAAGQRRDYPGGAERAVQEVKGDIVGLYFYDRLLTELGALKQSARPDMKVILCHVAEELYPVVGRILPAGSEMMAAVDYTASRVLRRREVLRKVPSSEIPCVLIYTLHDDNVGLLPQLSTGSLHELTKEVVASGWAGFSTRYWLTGDHDPCIGYLSKAAWETSATPDGVYRDQVRSVCGEACVGDMLHVFREVERTTVGLEWHGLGLSFPVPGMMMKHWVAEPMPEELKRDRESWLRALERARRAQRKTRPSGRSYVDYWVGRLEFGIGYLDAVEAVRDAAVAESQGRGSEALQHAESAFSSARRALEAYARVARDQSDRGAIAAMNEYVYRPLKAKVEELRRGGGPGAFE